eukprot:COSAG01_NODE_11416_length_1939_cov_2.758152_2_plen_78_part_00
MVKSYIDANEHAYNILRERNANGHSCWAPLLHGPLEPVELKVQPKVLDSATRGDRLLELYSGRMYSASSCQNTVLLT